MFGGQHWLLGSQKELGSAQGHFLLSPGVQWAVIMLVPKAKKKKKSTWAKGDIEGRFLSDSSYWGP